MLCLVNIAGSRHSLRTEFGEFLPSLFSYLESPGAFSSGSSTVPEWDMHHGLSFVQNYVRILDKSHERLKRRSRNPEVAAPLYHLDGKEIHSWPLAVWSKGRFAQEVDAESAGIPTIMVFGRWKSNDVTLIQQHYEARNLERWNRLNAAPEWIFHDLNSVFACCNTIRRLSARELRSRSLEVSDESFTGNVLQRMRRLNRAMAANILLRERLLIQQSSIKEITSYGSEKFTTFNSLASDLAETSFMSRCLHAEKSIKHDLLIAHGVLEQLQNLMAMIISIEQISSGQSVARLGVLGFVFLPLSYVAAVFGITTWSIEPKWYPVAAIPCLLLTITLAIFIPFGMSWSEQKGLTSHQTNPDNHPPDIFDDALFEVVTDVTRSRSPTREHTQETNVPPPQNISNLTSDATDPNPISEFERVGGVHSDARSEEYVLRKAESVRSGAKYHGRYDSEESAVERPRSSIMEKRRKQFLGRFWKYRGGDSISDLRAESMWSRLKPFVVIAGCVVLFVPVVLIIVYVH